MWNIMRRKIALATINCVFPHITVSCLLVTPIQDWQHITGLVNLQSTRSSVRSARLYGSKCNLQLCPNQLKGTGRESRRASEKDGIFPIALVHWTENTFPSDPPPRQEVSFSTIKATFPLFYLLWWMQITGLFLLILENMGQIAIVMCVNSPTLGKIHE